MRRSSPQIPPPSARELAPLDAAAPPTEIAQVAPAPPRCERTHLGPTPPPPKLAQVDAELHRLARGTGRLRLRVGQALDRLGDGIHELGFSSLHAYALERCNRSGRWAAESRTLAHRLQLLPHLTNALESGSVGWSMAELLGRHATPQTEGALLQVASGKTVQAMRIALSPQASTEPPDDDELTRTLSLTLPVEEAWALEATRMMVEHMDGTHTGSHFLESLLAEATVSLLELTAPTQSQESRSEDKAGQAPQAAQLIARVATPATERAWLERATRRTFKHLREEVQAVEMATRFAGQPDRSPPSEGHIEQMQSVERAILSGELLRRVIRNLAPDPDQPTERDETPNEAVQISVTPEDEAPDEPVQISVTPGSKVTLRIRVPGDVLLHYRQLERLHGQKLPNESFIQFLCTTFWQTWVPHLGTSDKWEQIYRRDRYRCTSPVCHQRNVTLHHVTYRANGGTDDPNNLTCPCPFCHLEGEHGGRLKILPPGHDPTWLLGRHPIMRVHRRERTLLN